MGIGSLFAQPQKSLARQCANKAVAKKKVGTFNIEWPAMPVQQVKDYKVITTASEVIAYFKRCEGTGLCGFDYETTVSDEYRGIWAGVCEDFRNKEARIITEYQEQIEAVDLTMSNITSIKKWEKERAAALRVLHKEHDRALEEFLAAPLDPWKADICTVSLSAAPHEARVVFISNPGNKRYFTQKISGEFTKSIDASCIEANRKEVFSIINEHLFKNKNITKIAVNLSFEAKQTAKLGMYILEPVADPFLMWVRCIQVVAPYKIKDPKSPASGKGLKPTTKEYFGVEMQDFKELLEKHGVQFFSEISADHPDAVNYSAEDSDYAVQHYLYWREIAKQIPMYDAWLHNIEMPFARVIGLMEYQGMQWDDTLAEQKKQEAEIMRDNAIAEIVELGKKFGVELEPGKTGKTGSVKDFLFNVLRVPIAKRSEKTNDPSLDEEALIDMKFMLERKLENLDEEKYLAVPEEQCTGACKASVIRCRLEHRYKEDAIKLIDLIQSVQTYSTLLSSHIVGRQKFLNEVSGRIHAGYSQWTETGRLNSYKPNAQNIPRMDNDVFGIRNFFVAPPGKVQFFVDFSGVEMRIMAWKSNDEVMIYAFNYGDGDLHRITASTITGKEPKDVTKAERSRAKAPNFLISYGGSEYALQINLKKDYGVRETLDECAKLIKAVKTTYPGIPAYQESIALEAREQGYVQTGYGYIRLLPNISSSDRRAKGSDERRAANTPIQGFVADIMKRCQNEVYELLGSNEEYRTRAALFAQIHDEQLFELDDDPEFVQRFVADIKKIMEKPPLPNFSVPMVADASIGYRWGEKMSLAKWLEGKNI